MNAHQPDRARRPRGPRTRAPRTCAVPRSSTGRRVAHGLLAGLLGAAAVDLAGRAVAKLSDHPRRPTLPAQLVAKSVRLPDISQRRRGHSRRSLSTLLGLETPAGTDPARVQQVGTTAHYLWGAAWGALRVGLDSRAGNGHAALAHFLAFAVTDHFLLATANVGAPIWARHDHPLRPDGDTRDAAMQLAQLVLYITATNVAYSAIHPGTDRQPDQQCRRSQQAIAPARHLPPAGRNPVMNRARHGAPSTRTADRGVWL